jgi:hypothetical protein
VAVFICRRADDQWSGFSREGGVSGREGLDLFDLLNVPFGKISGSRACAQGPVNYEFCERMKKMTETYGHQHLGFLFRELCQTSDEGITYKGKKYEWKDIDGISRGFGSLVRTLFMYGRRQEGMTVCLKDGKKIRINTRVFTKAGQSPKFDTSGFVTGESRAFTEFADLLSRKTGIST